MLQVAALQGYLLKNKTRPRECVDEVAEWVVQERETREKLKKEKFSVGVSNVDCRCDARTYECSSKGDESGWKM